MSSYVVVDASLAVKWLVNEELTAEADSLALSWTRSGNLPVAPYLMPVEVANALFQYVARGRLSLDGAVGLLRNLLNSGMELMEPAGLHTMALELASRLQLGSIYDAHYLALAEILDCEMWTADRRFFQAASPFFQRVRWLGEGSV